CALGADEYQFQAMSARLRHRPSAFEQSLECIRALWQGEAVSLNSRWQFKDVRIAPQPPSPIEVWIGASADIAIDRAVRLGDVWLAEPGMTLKESAGRMAVYQDALSRHQKAASRVAIRRDIYVAESSEDASATMDKVRKNGYRGFDPDALMIGEPAAIAQQIQAFESLGYTDIIIRNLHEDAEKALASTRRLALVKKLLAET
ncbi:MAG: LLM class flavin-dependent oxidoreductase, partial [Gammaproteobacteria bacterium]|nr:LLM class flavin-dependent oxidoreductase [Gammaproteobacteria bacterium]